MGVGPVDGKLAERLTAQASAIAERWAARSGEVLRARGVPVASDELHASCVSGLEALVRYLQTGQPYRLDAWLESLVAARLPTRADIGDVVEEILSVLPSAIPVLATEGDADTATTVPFELANRFQRAVITAASRACPLFATRKRAVLKISAIREERRRLAREIHDHLAQSAYGVGLLAETAGRLLDDGDREGAADQLRRIEAISREWLAEMRICLFDLRPADVRTNGLAGALRSRLESVEERAGVRASLTVDGWTRPPLEVEKEMLGIAVELLNNALKHSQARDVSVVLRQHPEMARLDVADDGVGFSVVEARTKGGHGLSGIDERALRIAGRVTIDSFPGGGTRVRIEVPIRRQLREPAREAAYAGT